MTAEVFVHDDLNSYQDIKKLADDFAAFMDETLEPDYFGRDGDYGWPQLCKNENLRHLHLSQSASTTAWSKIKNLYRRTSNKHLVYCPGFYNEDCYLLIAILDPDAHEQARNTDIMLALGAIAAEFRGVN